MMGRRRPSPLQSSQKCAQNTTFLGGSRASARGAGPQAGRYAIDCLLTGTLLAGVHGCSTPLYLDKAEVDAQSPPVLSPDAQVAATGAQASAPASDAATLPGADSPSSTRADGGWLSVYDASEPAPSEVAPVVARDAGQPTSAESSEYAVPGKCSLKGTFSLRATYRSEWDGRALAGVIPLARAGTGEVTIYMRVQFEGKGHPTRSQMRGCGVSFPDFEAGASERSTERYTFYFRDEIWDTPTMPMIPVIWEPVCSDPGCRITSDPLTWWLGIDPKQAMAATAPLTELEPYDHDGDNEIGVTLMVRVPPAVNARGEPYSPLPLTLSQAYPRSSRLNLAFRHSSQLNAELESCDKLKGIVNQAHLEFATVGCFARASATSLETRCTPEQVRFVRQNEPKISTPYPTPFEAVRVKDDGNCVDVRAAWN
jgi:hypothetical protein